MNSNPTEPGSCTFVSVGAEHEQALIEFFQRNQDAETTRFFNPFPLNRESAVFISGYSGMDLYLIALDSMDTVRGLSMLRGWDEGYDIPSFGILIDKNLRGRGLGRSLSQITLRKAFSSGVQTVRLSVHPENTGALALYTSLGFQKQEHIDSDHLEMRLTSDSYSHKDTE